MKLGTLKLGDSFFYIEDKYDTEQNALKYKIFRYKIISIIIEKKDDNTEKILDIIIRYTNRSKNFPNTHVSKEKEVFATKVDAKIHLGKFLKEKNKTTKRWLIQSIKKHQRELKKIN